MLVSSAPLCIAFHWLTSLVLKPCCMQWTLAVEVNSVLHTWAQSAICDCVVVFIVLLLAYVIISPHRSSNNADVVYCYWLSSAVCSSVCLSVCHTSEPCRNGWTDWFAVWIVDSGGLNEAEVQSHLSNTIEPSVWTDRFAVWVVELARLKEAQVQSYLPGGTNVPSHNAIEPCVCSGGAALSDYFDHLLLLLAVECGGWSVDCETCPCSPVVKALGRHVQ